MRWCLAVLVAGCSADLGPSAAWIDATARAGAFTPELAAAPSMLASARQVRIVTFNVNKGQDVAGLARAITTTPSLAAADILLVQELEAHPGEGPSRARRLADALGMGYVYAPERIEGDGTHGPAIFSRWELEHAEVMELPFADLAFSSAPRIALAANIRIGAHVLRVVDLHLDTRLNVGERILQMRPAVLDEPWPTIVGGDLNTNPYAWVGDSVPQVPAGAIVETDQAPAIDDYMRHIDYATPTAELGPTLSFEGLVDSRLDAIYTRGVLAVPGGVERDVNLSDHWPVFIDAVLSP